MNIIMSLIAERFTLEREAWTGGAVLMGGMVLNLAEVGPDWIQIPTALISVPLIAHGWIRGVNTPYDSPSDTSNL